MGAASLPDTSRIGTLPRFLSGEQVAARIAAALKAQILAASATVHPNPPVRYMHILRGYGRALDLLAKMDASERR